MIRNSLGCSEDQIIPDYDGSLFSSNGICVLTINDASEIMVLIDRLTSENFDIYQTTPTPGHYGDGGWAGAELVEHHDEGWILFINS